MGSARDREVTLSKGTPRDPRVLVLWSLTHAPHMAATYVGRSLTRIEDERLLRGDATFVDDLKMVGMLHVVFVRSIHAHARIRVDAGAALGTSGVVGVFCMADLEWAGRAAEIPTVVDHEALRPCRQPVMAHDKVRYVGEPIAAVVATNPYAAGDGAARVKIEYEPLAVVPDAHAAIAAGAAVLHEALGDNVAADFTVRVSDADAAFRSAEIVTRGRYR